MEYSYPAIEDAIENLVRKQIRQHAAKVAIVNWMTLRHRVEATSNAARKAATNCLVAEIEKKAERRGFEPRIRV